MEFSAILFYFWFSEVNPIHKAQLKPFSFAHPEEGRMTKLNKDSNLFLKLCSIHYKMLINQFSNILFDMISQIIRDHFVVNAQIFSLISFSLMNTTQALLKDVWCLALRIYWRILAREGI